MCDWRYHQENRPDPTVARAATTNSIIAFLRREFFGWPATLPFRSSPIASLLAPVLRHDEVFYSNPMRSRNLAGQGGVEPVPFPGLFGRMREDRGKEPFRACGAPAGCGPGHRDGRGE